MSDTDHLSYDAKRSFIRCAIASFLLFSTPVLVAGAEQSAKSKPSDEAGSKSTQAATPKAPSLDATNSTPPALQNSNSVANAPGPVIEGERFSVRQILDTQQGGLPVCEFIAPE